MSKNAITTRLVHHATATHTTSNQQRRRAGFRLWQKLDHTREWLRRTCCSVLIFSESRVEHSLKYRSDYSSFLRITYNVKSLRLSFVNFAAFFTKTYLRKCVRSLFRLHFTLTFLKYVCTEIAEFQFFTDLLWLIYEVDIINY